MKMLRTYVATCLLLVCNAVFAQSFTVDNIKYEVLDGGNQVAIAGFEDKTQTTLMPPERVTFEGQEYTVTSIGESAFEDCTSLTSVVIPNSVTSIGSGAFSGCRNLTSVHIDDIAAWCNIEFGRNPFNYAKNLYLNGEKVTELVIPNGVTSIGDYAFYYCEGLTSVVIPNSMTSIGMYAFEGCSGLTSVHIDDIAAWCDIEFGSSSANPLSYAKNLYLNGEKVTELVIPNSVTSIGYCAFSGCSSLTSVVIPNSVTSIGYRAFDECSSLISVEIPNSVTSIEESAFSGCSGLTSVVIPNSVTSIGDYVFSGCSSLTSVVIPNSVTSIGRYAFSGCSDLTSVEIGNNVTRIGDYAFEGCTRLTSVVIPNSVTSIGSSAFSGCTKLSSVTFPQNISISTYAFSNCTSLKEVVLPDTVKALQTNSFRNCTALHTVTMPSKCSSIKLDVFQGCSAIKFVIMRSPTPLKLLGTQQTLNGAYLIVPNGSLETYAKDRNWGKWSMYEMDQYTLNFVTIPNKMEQLYSMIQLETQTDFADHGLLTSPSQITTNKLEPTEGSIEALLDNDKETYFHSTWSVANESLDNYHFLEVDLGKTVKEFTLNYARRSHGTVSSPRVIHVYATNDPNGEWKDMGTYTCELTYYCFIDEDWLEVRFPSTLVGYSFNGSTTAVSMDDKYRYVRLVVEQTYTGPTDNNIYFTLSELAIFETFDGYKVDLSRFLTEEECSQLSNDITQITEASATFGGTDQMVNTLDAWINRIQEGILTGVDQVTVKPTTVSKGVYSISGKLVKTQSDNLNDLPKGVYIVNGKKVVK